MIYILLLCSLSAYAETVEDIKKSIQQQTILLRTTEKKLLKADNTTVSLTQKRLQTQRFIHTKQQKLVGLSRTLYALIRHVPLSLFKAHLSPEHVIRAHILVRGLINNIQMDIKRLHSTISSLHSVEEQHKQHKISLHTLLKKRQKEAQRLESLLRKKRILLKKQRQKQERERKRREALARKVKSMQDLLHKLPAHTPDKHSKGFEYSPVVGRIISYFNQQHDMDWDGTGVIYDVSPNSYVYAPQKGNVVYAGPFRNYKQVLILSHDQYYHTVLIGMSDIDATVGQSVIAGEILGRMSDTGSPKLYIELRYKGSPIDPLPWLRGATS